MKRTGAVQEGFWVGGILAVALTIAGLNLIPSAPQGYWLRIRVTGDKPRLMALKRRIPTDVGLARRTCPDDGNVIVGIVPVGTGNPSPVSGSTAMAADLFCFYRTRPTHTRLAENIQAQSRSLLGGQPETDCAKLLRCVRWQQESLQHGLEQLAVDEAVAAQRKWLAATQAGPNGDKDYAVAAREIVDGHSDPLDFVLHRPVVNETKQESDSTPVPDTERTDNSFQTASSSSDLPEGDLVSHLRNRAAELASLARELQVQQDHLEERMLGTLAIADSMDIRTLHASMTPTQLVGMLVLGVSIWIGTVLLYWNWARGSSTHPQRAIAWLERLGIPLRGSISTWNPVEVAQGSASSESRYARVLHRIGEGLLAVLILAIALRIVSDPEWRHLLATDPLAGLGHLVRS